MSRDHNEKGLSCLLTHLNECWRKKLGYHSQTKKTNIVVQVALPLKYSMQLILPSFFFFEKRTFKQSSIEAGQGSEFFAGHLMLGTCDNPGFTPSCLGSTRYELQCLISVIIHVCWTPWNDLYWLLLLGLKLPMHFVRLAFQSQTTLVQTKSVNNFPTYSSMLFGDLSTGLMKDNVYMPHVENSPPSLVCMKFPQTSGTFVVLRLNVQSSHLCCMGTCSW